MLFPTVRVIWLASGINPESCFGRSRTAQASDWKERSLLKETTGQSPYIKDGTDIGSLGSLGEIAEDRQAVGEIVIGGDAR